MRAWLRRLFARSRPAAPAAPPLDLALIQQVQRARMAHDADAVPSQVSAVYWIEAKPSVPTRPPTTRAGFWLIETDAAHVDAVWAKVRDATQAGLLGYKAKVSTASHTAHPAARVVQVLTRDAADADDVARVGQALRALGIADAVYQAAAGR
jgi:hypothetical protein